MKKNQIRTLADRYAKVVEWSDEDDCYVGRVPALGCGGVHGKNRQAVFEEVCRVAEEIVAIHAEDNRALPSPTPRRYSGKFVLRIPPSLHEAIALHAKSVGQSLNSVVETAIRKGLPVA